MDSNSVRENWNEIKSMIKEKWAGLPDQEIEASRGNLDRLEGKVQQLYRTQPEKAEREFGEFKVSVQNLLSEHSSSLDRLRDVY